MKKINALLYRFFWVLWILGLHYFYLYYFFFKNIKYLFKEKIANDGYLLVMMVFFFFQLFSSFCSINSPYFSYERFAAIIHNEIVYLFMVVGYLVYQVEPVRQLLKKNTLFLFLWVISIVVVSGLASYALHRDLSFDNIISKVIHSFPPTTFTKTGWYEGVKQMRSMAFTIFPNSTGILLMVLYALSYEALLEKPFIFRVGVAFVLFLGIYFTGSRIVTLFGLLNIVLVFFKRPDYFKLAVVLGILLLIPLAQIFIERLTEVYTARGSSNNARYFIQSYSLNLMYKTSPVIGIGLKPRLDELLGGEFPVGSHSTYIGYFVKNGIVGGTFILLFFLNLILNSSIVVLREKYNYHKFIINILFIEILIILFFEDLDAYELNALLFGFLMAYVKSTYYRKKPVKTPEPLIVNYSNS